MLVLSGYWLDEGIVSGEECRYFRKYMRMKMQ